MSDTIQPPELSPTPKPTPSPIFFGSNGLRAGWSLLIASVLVVVLFMGVNAAIRASHLLPHHAMENSPGPFAIFISEAAGLFVTAVVTWIMAKIERRPIGIYGLGGDAKISRLLIGVAIGLAAISLLIFILIKGGLLLIDRRLLFGSDIARYALLWIPGFLAISFFEEYFARGYLQYTLGRGLAGLAPHISSKLDPRTFGFWTAAVIVSFGFGAVHGSNPGESPAGLICAGLAALLFCFSLWRTGSLWWAVGMHAAWDYGQSFLFGVADSGIMMGHRLLATHPVGKPLLSGGVTGPEGSIFCVGVLAALALVVHITQPRGPHGYASRMPEPAPPIARDADSPALAS